MRVNAKPKVRDARDFDTTALSEKMHGRSLHRDYSAHFFRWSFARRFINNDHGVLEVGCGPERPLWRMLFHQSMPLASWYTGVDLNPLDTGLGAHHAKSNLIGEFDFTKHYKKMPVPDYVAERGGYDVAVNFEVIEHMKVEHGRKLLRGMFHHLRPGGTLLLSTPCYDGKRHAANHIHEYTVPELQKEIERAGFVVAKRYGTFMDVRHLKPKNVKAYLKAHEAEGWPSSPERAEMITTMAEELGGYFDNHAISCIFATLFPDAARNNLWVCVKPEDA
jgi:2-polyprenyl-3-methyl-5-hydroxy-6-metoxy-1,4-benzoquinol methylase